MSAAAPATAGRNRNKPRLAATSTHRGTALASAGSTWESRPALSAGDLYAREPAPGDQARRPPGHRFPKSRAAATGVENQQSIWRSRVVIRRFPKTIGSIFSRSNPQQSAFEIFSGRMQQKEAVMNTEQKELPKWRATESFVGKFNSDATSDSWCVMQRKPWGIPGDTL